MNCPNCQHLLPPEGMNCPGCGIPIPQYESPEGFDYDQQSGLYYSSQVGMDAKSGKRMEYVTWFDPYSGAYEPKAYPMEETGDTRRKRTGNRKKRVGNIAAALVLLLGGTAYAFELHTYLPFMDGPEIANVGDDSAQTAAGTVKEAPPNQIEAEAPQVPMQGEVPETGDTSEEPEGEPEPDTAVSTDWRPAASTGQWFDFPHISLFYTNAAEDASHVYFLQTHTDGIIGSLYRMDRDGSNLVHIIGDEPGQGVYSFALVDDMIYLAIALDNFYSGYYRVPKTGGEAEFLFEQEHSYMQAYEGELYFIFMRQLSMGIYRPDLDTAPRLTPLIEWDDSDPTDPPSPLSEFSIYDGYLYYADAWEMARGYYRMNLATLENETLLSGVSLQENALCNVAYNGDTCYYSHFNELFTEAMVKTARVGAVEGQSVQIGSVDITDDMYIVAPLVARTNTLLVWQNGGDVYCSPLEDMDDSRLLCSTDTEPSGITEDWAVFIGELYNLHTNERLEIGQPGQGPVIYIG